MPPALDTPEEVAAMLGALFGLLGIIGAGIIGALSAVLAAWRLKVKPLLTTTQRAASAAAEQVTPNHGSTMRDSVSRIETTLDRLDRSMNARIGDVRADLRTHVAASDRAHEEIRARLHQIESPLEDTRP